MTLTAPAPFTRAVPGLVVVVTFTEDGGTVIGLRGEADRATLSVLTYAFARVIADHDGAVVVDLVDTEFVDTATVRALVRAEQLLSACDRQLTLLSPSRLAVWMLALFDSPLSSSLTDRSGNESRPACLVEPVGKPVLDAVGSDLARAPRMAADHDDHERPGRDATVVDEIPSVMAQVS